MYTVNTYIAIYSTCPRWLVMISMTTIYILSHYVNILSMLSATKDISYV